MRWIPAEHQTDELCRVAIRNGWGGELSYVAHQTEQLCSLAVSKNREDIKYVRDPEIYDKLKECLDDDEFSDEDEED